MAKRSQRATYRKGQTVEFATGWQTKPGVGTVTWVTENRANLLTDGRPNFLYRVEVANGYGAFGNSTRYVYEYQITRVAAVSTKKAA